MFDQNLETIRSLVVKIAEFPPFSEDPEKVRIRTAWDNLTTYTLQFVDTAEQLETLCKRSRNGNRAFRELARTRAAELEIPAYIFASEE